MSPKRILYALGFCVVLSGWSSNDTSFIPSSNFTLTFHVKIPVKGSTLSNVFCIYSFVGPIVTVPVFETTLSLKLTVTSFVNVFPLEISTPSLIGVVYVAVNFPFPSAIKLSDVNTTFSNPSPAVSVIPASDK